MFEKLTTEQGKLKISPKTIQVVLVMIISLIAAGSLLRFYVVSSAQLKAPHDIFFETPNLATIKSIRAGEPIYSPQQYNNLPFVITIYNPLFHYLAATLPQSTTNPFLTGRLVSLSAMLLLCLILFLPGEIMRCPIVPLLAVGYFFLIREPVNWAAYLRSDTLALLLSALAVVTAEKWAHNRGGIILSAVFCLAAFTAKQTFLSATGTCLAFFFLRDRKDGIWFGCSSIILFSAFLLFSHLRWGSGYWVSAYVSMLSAGFDPEIFLTLWGRMLEQPLFIFLVLATIVSAFHVLRQGGLSSLLRSPYLLYAIAAMVVAMISVAKKGADTNYFIEVILACLLWNVFYIRGSNPALAIKPLSIPAMMVVFLFGALELTQTPERAYSYTNARTTAFVQGVFRLARKELGALRPPDDRFLNLHSPTATYSLQCQSYVNDPFIYWHLWNRGVLDPGPLLEAIQNKYFSVIMFSNSDSPIGVITPFKDTGPESPARRVLETTRRNYQFAKKGVYLYFVPRQQNPAW